jgi:hypothetical protein
MSLSREEWEEMWKTILRLEDCVREGIPPHSGYKKSAVKQVNRIKQQIQSVIGQQE